MKRDFSIFKLEDNFNLRFKCEPTFSLNQFISTYKFNLVDLLTFTP